MVGFTVPVAAAGAATAKLAYDMDASITKIQKVYDAGANGVKASNAAIRNDAEQSARQLAMLYGQSSKDTLDIMQELAAAGKTGADLQQQTADVSRAALLGDLNRQDALKTNITLQSAYNLSTQDLADTWNFFNSVENSTVLTMQDITEALPRVSGIMNTLGVSVQDTTTLLAGFKAAGIDVVEGATALKSISFKIFNPSKKAASAFEELTGIDYKAVIEQGKGELIPTLTAISKAIEPLSNIQKTQVIGDLAGIHQGSKFAGLLTQLQNIGDATTQIGRANQVAQQSTTDWANTANGELATLQDSVSNKLKRAFETLKVELAETGKPFLEVGSSILNVVLKIVQAFNGMPDGAKKFAVITAILLAATGPAIMLVGLTANLFGNFLKMGTSLVLLATRFNLVTKEQAAAKLASKAAEVGYISESAAIMKLTAEMEKYRLAQQAASAPIMSRTTPTIVNAPPGNVGPGSMANTMAAGAWLPANIAQAQQNNAAASTQAAAASQKQSEAMRGVAASGALFAGSMVASAVSSNETVDRWANIAMITSIAAPAAFGLAKSLKSVDWAAIGSTISTKISGGMAAATGATSKFTTAFKAAQGVSGKTGLIVKGIGGGIMGLLGPMGMFLIAVGAVVAAWKLIDHSVNKTADAIKEQSNNKALGGILGYEPRDQQAIAQTSKSVSAIHDKVAQIRNEFGGVIDNIQKATSEQDKFNIAMENIGLQVISQGGTIQQAQEAVKLALQAAGKTAAEADAIVIRFKSEFDSSGIVDQATRAAQDFQKSAISSMQDMNLGETLQNNLKNDQYISKASEQFGKDAGDKIAQGIRTSMDAGLGQGKMLTNIDATLKPLGDKLAELRKQQQELWAQPGMKGTTSDKKLSNQITQYEKLRAAVIGQTITNLSGADATKKFTESQLANMTATEALKNGYITLTDADMLQYLQAKKSSGAVLDVGEAEKLAALQAAELAKKSQTAATGVKATGKAAVDSRTDLEKLAGTFKDLPTAYAAFADAAQSGTKAAMNEYAQQAQTNFQNRMDAAMDSYKSSQSARMDALQSMQDKASKALDKRQESASRALDARQDSDNKRLETRQKAAQRRLDTIQQGQSDALDKAQENRRKVIEASYDSRIDKIKATMATEQAAEDQRQKIFEAELTRISRLAEVANRNIDFNAALNSGNMDEAAKIMNDAQAQQQTWSLSDANDSAASAFQKRQDALGASIDSIEKAKQSRLDALKAVDDAEKKALAASQQRQTDALAAQQEREKAALAIRLQAEKDNLAARFQAEKDNMAARQKAEQASLQASIDRNVKAQQRIWDANKAQLDRAIVDFQNFAPRNAAELQKHINDISGKYDQFRLVTRGKFNGTAADVKATLSRNITAAMNELAANQAWAAVGAQIATKMTKGAFNMDINQFIKWVTTGETPKGWTASKAATDASTAINNAQRRNKVQNQLDRNGASYHVGGKIGVDPGGRGGITGSKLHRSEVPIVAQRGEFMVNKKQSAKHIGVLQAINSGNYDGEGYGAAPLGLAGMLGAGIAAAGSQAIAAGIQVAAARRMTTDAAAAGVAGGFYTSAKAGRYGGGSFSAEQLGNAAIIANVGSNMNMNARDIEIGIMTAITESGLRNLHGGDRDSQGLFQQRPSQGWGTVAQITDPTYAAGKFFEALKGVKNRGAMDPWAAAQSVQRSAFSDGGNYRQYWDEAMAIFGGMGQDGGGLTGGPIGPANKTGQNAIAWAMARLGDGGWLGLCQKFVRMSLGAGAGFPSAIAAWNGAKLKHGISNSSAVPAGVPVYWGGGAFGHVALSTGGGGIISTDFPTSNKIGKGTIAGLTAKWHKPLLGWTEDINGKRIYGMPGLRKGAHTLSDGLAMLHKKETVLTAPLSEKLKEGVNNLADGGGNQYTITVDARGTDLNEAQIARLAIAGIEAKEARKPTQRKGND
jgi:TP901 family phage tail tape measure protein